MKITIDVEEKDCEDWIYSIEHGHKNCLNGLIKTFKKAYEAEKNKIQMEDKISEFVDYWDQHTAEASVEKFHEMFG